MGNLNCSNCKSKEDYLEEIKSDTSFQNGHRSALSSNDFGGPADSKPKEFQNPYIDYSLALFQRFNLIRTEPLKFYSESDKYNLSKIIEELIDKNDKTLKLTWSAKKEIIAPLFPWESFKSFSSLLSFSLSNFKSSSFIE